MRVRSGRLSAGAMKRLLVIALLSTRAHAGWFGVHSYDDCITTYAVPVHTSDAVGAATRACVGIYKNGHEGQRKERDQCVLDHVLDVKANNAIVTLVRTCKEAHPVCQPNERETDATCETKCPVGQRYIRLADEDICLKD